MKNLTKLLNLIIIGVIILSSLGSASEDDPTDVATVDQIPLLIQSGDLQFKNGKYDAALLEYQKGLKLLPEHYELLMKSGECYAKLGQWFPAVVQFEAAYAKDKSAHAKLILAYRNYGNELLAGTNFKQAVEYYNRLLKINAGDREILAKFEKWESAPALDEPNVLKQDVRFQALLAETSVPLSKKRYGIALGHLERALKLRPDDLNALKLSASTNAKQRRWEDAIPAFEKVYGMQKSGQQINISQKIENWHVIGPFPFKEGQGRDTVYPIEEQLGNQPLDLTKTHEGINGTEIGWHEVNRYVVSNLKVILDMGRKVNLFSAGGIAYAFTEIDAPAETLAQLSIGSDDGIKVWLNDRLVWDNAVRRALKPEQDKVTVMFKKKNRLLVKIDDRGGVWGFSAKIDQPESGDIREELIDAYKGQGDDLFSSKAYEEAVASYNRVLEFQPKRIGIHLRIAEAHGALGKLKDAVDYIEKTALTQNPQSVPALMKLAEIHRDGQNHNDAIAAYERVLEIDSKNVLAITGLGDTYNAQSQYKKALEQFKRAGDLYIARKDGNQAIIVYEKALIIAPDDVEIIANVGKAYQRRGALQNAIAEYERVLQLSPDHRPTLIDAGDTYIAFNSEQKTRLAITVYDKAIQLRPDDIPLRLKLAKAYLREKRYPGAYDEFEKALEVNPQNSQVYTAYAQALIDNRRHTQAIHLLKTRALAQNPSAINFHRMIAKAYEGQGKLGLAMATYQEILSIEKGSGNTNEARREIKRLRAEIQGDASLEPEKLILVVFGTGTNSDDTINDPQHRHIPYLWNKLRPLGTLYTDVSLNNYTEERNIFSALVTGQWGQDLESIPIDVEGAVVYSRHIQPIFSRNCTAYTCHIGGDDAAGGLTLTSFQALTNGSYNGDVIIPGSSVESRLVQHLEDEADPPMPPDETLSQAQIQLIKRWVDEGALNDNEVTVVSSGGVPTQSSEISPTSGESEWDGRPTFPTLFERYRKLLDVPSNKVWFITSNAKLTKMGFSKDPDYGETFRATSISPELMTDAHNRLHQLHDEWEKAGLSRGAIREKLSTLSSRDLCAKQTDGLSAEIIVTVAKKTRSFHVGAEETAIDDRLAYLYAHNVLEEKHPSLLVTAFTQPSEPVNKRRDDILKEIAQADSFTYYLWETAAKIPDYREKTNFIVVLPHPHENRADVLVIGPRIPQNRIETNEKRRADDPFFLTDLMSQIADMLEFDYAVPLANLQQL